MDDLEIFNRFFAKAVPGSDPDFSEQLFKLGFGNE